MKKTVLLTTALVSSTVLLLVFAWRGEAQSGATPRQTSLILGQALPGLTEEDQAAFAEGLRAFSTVEGREEGLGPVFNGTSCAECHKAGAIGGAASDLQVALVRRIGGMKNGVYSDLTEFGGPVLQARSLREFDTDCPIDPERVPRQANFVSHRITTPLFGAGLIEAIPAEEILSRTKRRDSDGVLGVANVVSNPETGQLEVGRFGWKAQHSSLHLFAGDAYLNEMGITSKLFPHENLPQGKPIPKGWDAVHDPEDQDGDVEKFTTFMRLLAPPSQRIPVTTQVRAGERVFQKLRCSSCHVPEMQTGNNTVSALANQRVRLFSDLLLHRMGDGLADGIQQGVAMGDQFRTAPLWGLSRRNFFLHDGRAKTPEEAILFHGGEAKPAVDRFLRLNEGEKANLSLFLRSL